MVYTFKTSVRLLANKVDLKDYNKVGKCYTELNSFKFKVVTEDFRETQILNCI